jgi:hypothetical protein
MDWEVINFDYTIDAWKKDMDVVSTKRTQRKTTGLELDKVTLQLEELWITERQLEENDNTITMTELEMDDLMVELAWALAF